MLLISAHILDHLRKLWLFRKWDQGMDINSEKEALYTTQHQNVMLKYMENEYCAKHRRLPVSKSESIPHNNLFSPTIASRCGQSSYDLSDLSTYDEEYLMPTNVAKMRCGQSDRTAPLMTAASLYLYSPPQLPQNWGEIIRNHNDYHSDPMEINGIILDAVYHGLGATARGNALKVRPCIHCGTWYILYHTTWCWSESQLFPWARCNQLEAVETHWRDPSWKSNNRVIGSCQCRVTGRQWCSIGYDKSW